MNKYEHIINYIKKEISNGTVKAGQKLPSIRSICGMYNCSKITVVKAYEFLEKEHLVYSIPKSGYYLIENNLISENKISQNIIDFSTSYPDSEILPFDDFQHCINMAMERYKINLFTNSIEQGLPSLINVLLKQLQNYQVFAAKENIFITSGSQQAINILTMMNFPNSKVNVLVEQPTYHGILKSLALNNVKPIGINRTNKGIDFNEFERILKSEHIKFFYTIPRFHNPTGFSYTNMEKKRIIELCNKYDVYIVEDDYLADLEADTKSDPLYALDIYSRVIYLKTFSKVVLPGLRISVNVLPNALTKTFLEYKKWNDLNTSILSQGALEIYIKNGMFDAQIKKLRNIYSERMNYLKELTKNINNTNINWLIPNSGFFASFELNSDVDLKNIIENIYMHNVQLIDTSKFYLKNNFNNKFMRLSVSNLSKDEIKKGISIICANVP